MNQRRLRFLNHFNNALKVLLCGLLLYIAMDLLAVVLVSPSTPLGLGSSFSWSWGATTPIVFAILCRFGWTRGLALISVGSLIGWRVFIPLVNPDFGSGVGVGVVLAVFIDLTYHETKKAQIVRGKEPQNEFRLNVLKREHEVVQSLRPFADLIVTKDYEVIIP